GLDHLVHERVVSLETEDVVRELGLGGAAERGCGERGHQSTVLTSTMPPTDPGTAPAISNRLRSTSTSATFRPLCVTRRSPMWPCGATPACFRWPTSGWLSLRSLTSPKASCTAP